MHQRQAIDETGNVRAEVVLSSLVSALQFDGAAPVVVLGIIKVDETTVGLVEQLVIELSTEVVVVGNTNQFAQFLLDSEVCHIGIEAHESVFEDIHEDIAIQVGLQFGMTNKGISQSLQMKQRRDLHTSKF